MHPLHGKWHLPRLDAVSDIELRITEERAASSDQEKADTCALALELEARGYPAVVMNDIALIYRPATRALIAHAKARGNRRAEGVKVGDMVLWRYRLSKPTRAARKQFDNGHGFPPGDYVLRAPGESDKVNRRKASETRRERADAYRDGEEPRYSRVTRLVRAAQVNAILRGEEAA